MNEQPVSVSKISWQDLCPWTNIFKTLTIAISPSVLVWAIVGVVVAPIGWLLGEMLFFDEAMRANESLTRLAEINRSPFRSVFAGDGAVSGAVQTLGPWLVFEQLVDPFRKMFESGRSVWEFMYFTFGSIWSLLVWSFAGCAITRVCLLRLTRNEAISIDDAFGFACKKYVDCVCAVAMPLLGVALLCLPMFLLGMLITFDLGAFIASLLWFIVLAIAIVMVLLLLGLMLGWPLIVSSISAEGQNSFDATTRAFAYTMQRPINYVFYILVAALFGGFCWLVAGKGTQAAIDMSYWATSWGANMINPDRIDVLRATDAESTVMTGAIRVTSFWVGFAKTIAAAFLYGLFWCLSSAVYLLLRKDVDETEMDEIFILNEQRTYDLPPLKSDELGIPQIQDPIETSEPREDSTD